MKKKLFILLTAMLLIFAFSVTSFAKQSPGGTVLPDEEETTKTDGSGGNGDGEGGNDKPGTTPKTSKKNKSDKSPKTGIDTDLAIAFVAVITAAGVILVSKKKYSEAN